MAKKKFLVIGYGKMAKAVLSGVDAYDITVVKPNPLQAADARLRRYVSAGDLPAGYKPDIVLFAVKPDVLLEVLPQVAKRLKGKSPLYVTMIASKPMAYYAKQLGSGAKVVRVMPNLPIEVGQGITLVYPSKSCKESDAETAAGIFTHRSELLHCASELEFNRMAVLTSCTPGFLFRFGALIGNAIKSNLPKGSGLSDVQVKEIVASLFSGAGLYAQKHPEYSFEQMAGRVATKGGLTEAGLKSLKTDGKTITQAFNKAIRAANKRSDQLAKKK